VYSQNNNKHLLFKIYNDHAALKSRHVSQWNKKGKSGELRYGEVRTAEELLSVAANNQKKLRRAEEMLDGRRGVRRAGEEGSGGHSVASASTMKIVDMTGREQKIRHGYEHLGRLGAAAGGQKAQFELRELVGNLDILVGMTEDKIIQSEKK